MIVMVCKNLKGLALNLRVGTTLVGPSNEQHGTILMFEIDLT